MVVAVERRWRALPPGFLTALAATLYGVARLFEEDVFLRQNDHVGSILVQGAGLALVTLGAAWMLALRRRQALRRRGLLEAR